MAFPVFFVAVRSALILQFDGSLCPPRDPIQGFTYSPIVFASDYSNTKQVVGIDKLASCSASISLQFSHDNEQEERLVAFGGSCIPIFPGITSADTEYDGLLLGLTWLVNAVSSDQEYEYELKGMMNNNEHQILYPTTLIIRGDCKGVIDQLKSRSVPRKMEEKYLLAMDRIQTLRETYATICFEHVPRADNCFCDALCKFITNQKQAQIVASIQDLIELGEKDAAKKIYDECNKCNKNVEYTKKKRRISRHPKSDYFQQALDILCYTPTLCHSSRLALACNLVEASTRQEDASILYNLSKSFFLPISRQWSKIYYGENVKNSVGKDTLRRVSVACENLSNHFSGVTLEEHDRIICDGIKDVFEFCTSNKFTDYEYDDRDSTASSSILAPYRVISHIIRGVEAESLRNVMQTWNHNLALEGREEVGESCGYWMELS